MSLNQVVADPEAGPFLPSIGSSTMKFGGFRTNFQSRKNLLKNESPKSIGKIFIKQQSNAKPMEMVKVESSLRKSQAQNTQIFTKRQRI